MSFIITANLSLGKTIQTAPVYQYDSGMTLRFIGADLPDYFRVDFSNTINGKSKPVLGYQNSVEIPDEFFIPGETIYAWVVFTNGTAASTEKQVNIPIDARAALVSTNCSSGQRNIINQAITSLNDAAKLFEQKALSIEVDGNALVIAKLKTDGQGGD